jgi:hypothetical protein
MEVHRRSCHSPRETGTQGGKIERLALEHSLGQRVTGGILCVLANRFEELKLGNEMGRHTVHRCAALFRNRAQ